MPRKPDFFPTFPPELVVHFYEVPSSTNESESWVIHGLPRRIPPMNPAFLSYDLEEGCVCCVLLIWRMSPYRVALTILALFTLGSAWISWWYAFFYGVFLLTFHLTFIGSIFIHRTTRSMAGRMTHPKLRMKIDQVSATSVEYVERKSLTVIARIGEGAVSRRDRWCTPTRVCYERYVHLSTR